jgi:cell division protein FtsB
VYGNRGILVYFQLKAELDNAHQQLAALKSDRLEAENKVKLLRPQSLDLDMLDEKARTILGVSSPKEKKLYTENLN